MGSFVSVFTAEELPTYDPDQVTPGVIGFIAIGVIALAVIFLLVDMNRRIRRMKYREEVRELLAQEIAERDAAATGEAADEAHAAQDQPDDSSDPTGR